MFDLEGVEVFFDFDGVEVFFDRVGVDVFFDRVGVDVFFDRVGVEGEGFFDPDGADGASRSAFLFLGGISK